MRSFVPPMLLASGAPRTTAGWVAQPKLDGWRAQVHVTRDGVRAWTRRGNSILVPELDHLTERLGAHTVLLDGELVVMAGCVADFAALQDRMRRGPKGSAHRLGFVAFDVLAVDGRTLLAERWDARQAELDALELRTASVGTMPVFDDVHHAWELANAGDWEGIVYKRKASRWRAGERSADWRKRKVWRTDDFVVTAYRETCGLLDAVFIARNNDGALERCGTVEAFSRGGHRGCC